MQKSIELNKAKSEKQKLSRAGGESPYASGGIKSIKQSRSRKGELIGGEDEESVEGLKMLIESLRERIVEL